MIDIQITGDQEVALNLEALNDRTAGVVKQVIVRQSKAMARVIKSETTSKLRRRSGELAGSIKDQPVKIKGSSITGGAGFGKRQAYKAVVHAGPRGSSKVLQPKKSEYLAIPLPTASTRRPRRTPQTFIARSKAGNLLVAKRQGSYGFLPLFLLKKQVRVPRRIFMPEIAKKMTPRIMQDLQKSIDKEMS